VHGLRAAFDPNNRGLKAIPKEGAESPYFHQIKSALTEA